MVGLSREWMCHLDVWMGCGPVKVAFYTETRRSTEVCKGKVGSGVEPYTAETSELSLQEPTALEGPAGPRGCGYYVREYELLLFFLIFLPSPDIRILKFILSPLSYLTLTRNPMR